MISSQVAVRWMVGELTLEGFEALRLSVWGAYRLFGDAATYTIGVRSIPIKTAKLRAGKLPSVVQWTGVESASPSWKLDDRPSASIPELRLDHDCILWEMPRAMEGWLKSNEGAQLLAADPSSGLEPRRPGLCGIPPNASDCRPFVVGRDEVSICSPFPPGTPKLGRCGAHFGGFDMRELASTLRGADAAEAWRAHWLSFRDALYDRVGIQPMGSATCGTDVVVAHRHSA